MSAIYVLVADSQRILAESLAAALGTFEHLSPIDEHPTTGPKVIDAVERFRPDVLLLDYWMTDMEGPAVTARILRRFPDCKVLLLSWFHGPHEIEASLGVGAVGFLPKSVSLDLVAEAIRRAYSGENPVFAGELDELAETIAKRDSKVAETSARFARLTARELQVLGLLAFGAPLDEVASQLSISVSTLKGHIKSILTKSGARSHSEAVAMAIYCGLIQI